MTGVMVTLKNTEKESEMQINVNKYYPERFIKAEHLDGPSLATVEGVFEQELTNNDGKSEDKPVVRFAEPVCEHGPQELVLNKGRLQALVEAMGTTDTDGWIGKTITIYPDKVRAFGKFVDTVCITPKLASEDELRDGENVPF